MMRTRTAVAFGAFALAVLAAAFSFPGVADAQIVREPLNTREQPEPLDFRVPDGDVDQLRSFIERLLSAKKANLVADQLEDYQEKAPPAIARAGQRMVELLPDSNSPTARWAQAVRLQALSEMVDRLPSGQRRELVEEAQKYLTGKIPDQQDVFLARTLGEGLIDAREEPLAAQAFSGFADVFASTDLKVGDHGKAAEFFANYAKRLRQEKTPMELAGQDIAGRPFSLASLRGKVVLIHFTQVILGSGNAYEAHERMIERHAEYHRRGLEIVYVSVDRNQSEARKKVVEREIPWTVLNDSQRRLLQRFSITRLPYTMLVDRNGVLLAAQADDDIDRLLVDQFGGKER